MFLCVDLSSPDTVYFMNKYIGKTSHVGVCDGDVLEWLRGVSSNGDILYSQWVSEASKFVKQGLTPYGSHTEGLGNTAIEITWRDAGWWGSDDLLEYLSSKGVCRKGEPIVLLGKCYNGIMVDYYPGLQWFPVEHQSGGMSCKQFKFIGTPVLLSDRGARIANALSKYCDSEYGHSCVGLGGVRASEITLYVELLEGFGLSCESSWSSLMEGVSPIDMSEENLDILGEVVGLDTDLYEISRFSRDSFGFSNGDGWQIVVLYENCD